MRVALDMDGVIANFTKQACKVLGEPYPAEQELADYGWLFEKYGDPTCYKRIKGHLFWTSIEKFPWSDELIDIVDEETKGNWIFLTKPMIDPYCYSGKAEWLMTNYRKYLNKLVIIGADKSNLVRNPRDVLIDDHPKNVDLWKKAGGSTIFWTELGSAYDPEKVKQRLTETRNTLKQIKTL